jgi:hypothetical protein
MQWYGTVGPAGIPAEIVKRLNEAQVAALKLPEMREKLSIEAVEPMPMSPEQFGQFIKNEKKRWTALAKAGVQYSIGRIMSKNLRVGILEGDDIGHEIVPVASGGGKSGGQTASS